MRPQNVRTPQVLIAAVVLIGFIALLVTTAITAIYVLVNLAS